jgi:hypothetical protein
LLGVKDIGTLGEELLSGDIYGGSESREKSFL